MTLTRFNPIFSELTPTRDRLNQIFGRNEAWETEGAMSVADWAPSADIVEKENEILIKAELPGVDAKDVTVTVDNNVLTLKGERHLEKDVKKENYHRMECAYGTFSRSFSVPGFVDLSNVLAEYKDGLLTLTLPKKAESKGTRTVEIKAA
jgi:HSP20 family protein